MSQNWDELSEKQQKEQTEVLKRYKSKAAAKKAANAEAKAKSQSVHRISDEYETCMDSQRRNRTFWTSVK